MVGLPTEMCAHAHDANDVHGDTDVSREPRFFLPVRVEGAVLSTDTHNNAPALIHRTQAVDVCAGRF